MSDKKHVTIAFTIEMLDKLNPCAVGREAALAFLPAKISTDPEKNIALALKLACSDRAAACQSDVSWLMHAVLPGECVACCRYCTPGYAENECDDPMVIAQYLAWIADKLATDAGR